MEQSQKDNMDHHKYNCIHYTLVHKDKISLDQCRTMVYRKWRIQLEHSVTLFDGESWNAHGK
jgi:hypothetical protein